MTTDTTHGGEKLAAAGGQAGAVLSRSTGDLGRLPGFEVLRIHDHHFSGHHRMRRPAKLRTEQAIFTRYGCREPEIGIAARNHVLLDAKRRNIKAVDYVLGGHDEFYRLAQRNMQLIDLPGTVLMLDFPHPLLGYDVHGGC